MIGNHRISVLGNIYEPYFQLNVADVFTMDRFEYSTPVLAPYERGKENPWQCFSPQPSLWQFTHNCQGNYQSNRFAHVHKNDQEAADFNAYRIHFHGEDSFFFAAKDVHYQRMPHFSKIYKEVIRRLTTQLYNFSRIYMVTELAYANHLSVGVANGPQGELTLSVEDFPGNNLHDLFLSDQALRVEASQDVGLLNIRKQQGPIAFRAQKLTLTSEAKDRIIDNLYDSADPNIDQYAIALIDNGLFQLFPKIEINPANAIEFFEWTDMTLEDIEGLSNNGGE